MLTSEVARFLNVSEQTVRAWADSGKLKAKTTESGTRIFDRTDVIALREQLEKPEATDKKPATE